MLFVHSRMVQSELDSPSRLMRVGQSVAVSETAPRSLGSQQDDHIIVGVSLLFIVWLKSPSVIYRKKIDIYTTLRRSTDRSYDLMKPQQLLVNVNKVSLADNNMKLKHNILTTKYSHKCRGMDILAWLMKQPTASGSALVVWECHTYCLWHCPRMSQLKVSL